MGVNELGKGAKKKTRKKVWSFTKPPLDPVCIATVCTNPEEHIKECIPLFGKGD